MPGYYLQDLDGLACRELRACYFISSLTLAGTAINNRMDTCARQRASRFYLMWRSIQFFGWINSSWWVVSLARSNSESSCSSYIIANVVRGTRRKPQQAPARTQQRRVYRKRCRERPWYFSSLPFENCIETLFVSGHEGDRRERLKLHCLFYSNH